MTSPYSLLLSVAIVVFILFFSLFYFKVITLDLEGCKSVGPFVASGAVVQYVYILFLYILYSLVVFAYIFCSCFIYDFYYQFLLYISIIHILYFYLLCRIKLFPWYILNPFPDS